MLKVGRYQPQKIQSSHLKPSGNGRNDFGLQLTTPEIVGSCCDRLHLAWPVSNFAKQLPTTHNNMPCNRVWKRTRHVTSNIDASVCRLFARGLRNIYHDFKQLLTIIIHDTFSGNTLQHTIQYKVKHGWMKKNIKNHHAAFRKSFQNVFDKYSTWSVFFPIRD